LRIETRKRVQTNEAEEEEEEEEEERLYLQLETRERVQRGYRLKPTNNKKKMCKLTRRSPNAVARHRLKPQVGGTTPWPPNACLPAEYCWLVKVTGGPSPPKA